MGDESPMTEEEARERLRPKMEFHSLDAILATTDALAVLLAPKIATMLAAWERAGKVHQWGHVNRTWLNGRLHCNHGDSEWCTSEHDVSLPTYYVHHDEEGASDGD